MADTEWSALTKLMSGDNPKSEAEHYEAVGRFITAFATAEAAVHILARKLTGLPDETARALLSGMRLSDVTDRIRAMMRINKLDASIQAEIDACLIQLNNIGERRHRLVHRTSIFHDGALLVSNVMINKTAANSEMDAFKEPELKTMKSDARIIYLRLNKISNPDHHNAELNSILQQPWRYKHVPSKTPYPKSAGTSEPEKSPPRG